MITQGLSERIILKSRTLRDRLLQPINKVLATCNVAPNTLTILAAITGLSAAFVLFSSYWLFCVLLACHLLFDSLDGSLARYTKSESKLGKELDYWVDRLACLSFLIAIAVYLKDTYAFIIAGVYVLSILIHKLQAQKTPYYYSRTFVAITLCFIPLGTWVATVAYISAGVLSVYSVTLAFQNLLTKF